MRRPNIAVFNVALATGGCLLGFPLVQWLWPFEETGAWFGFQLLVAFAVCYAFALFTNRLASEIETEVGRVAGMVKRLVGRNEASK